MHTAIASVLVGPSTEALFRRPGDRTDQVKALGERLLMNQIDSWMTGVNRNIEGKQVRRIMRYGGGHPEFRERCEAVVADGCREFTPV